MHVSCPILPASHHIITFSYLLSDPTIPQFRQSAPFVKHGISTMLLYDSVLWQVGTFLPHLTDEGSLSHCGGEAGDLIIYWYTCQTIIQKNVYLEIERLNGILFSFCMACSS